jgi:hypothetical protein
MERNEGIPAGSRVVFRAFERGLVRSGTVVPASEGSQIPGPAALRVRDDRGACFDIRPGDVIRVERRGT